jgi:hypothetical protein
MREGLSRAFHAVKGDGKRSHPLGTQPAEGPGSEGEALNSFQQWTDVLKKLIGCLLNSYSRLNIY